MNEQYHGPHKRNSIASFEGIDDLEAVLGGIPFLGEFSLIGRNNLGSVIVYGITQLEGHHGRKIISKDNPSTLNIVSSGTSFRTGVVEEEYSLVGTPVVFRQVYNHACVDESNLLDLLNMMNSVTSDEYPGNKKNQFITIMKNDEVVSMNIYEDQNNRPARRFNHNTLDYGVLSLQALYSGEKEGATPYIDQKILKAPDLNAKELAELVYRSLPNGTAVAVGAIVGNESHSMNTNGLK